ANNATNTVAKAKTEVVTATPKGKQNSNTDQVLNKTNAKAEQADAVVLGKGNDENLNSKNAKATDKQNAVNKAEVVANNATNTVAKAKTEVVTATPKGKQNSDTKQVLNNSSANNYKNITADDEKSIARLKRNKGLTIPNLEPGFYVITNVFSDHKLAIKWDLFLKNKGYKTIVFINPKNNWHYVSIFNSKDPYLAFQERKIANQEAYFEGIWVYKVNF
ncbi:MAG: hypothetical protein ACPG6B_09290, partial [Oceanihabitans sp.]